MLYNPVRFRGVHVPGLLALARLLPTKLRDVPGIKEGGIGWQGIIPSRAGKLGTIAVDKQIEKIGTPSEFYEQLGPDEIADHIARHSDENVRDVVEHVMESEHPALWRDLPPRAREALHERVRAELPAAAHEVTARIGEHVDELLDVRHMVIRVSEGRPELTNKLFHEAGRKEFRLIIRFGFVFGFLFSLPIIPLLHAVPEWWVLPVAEAFVGYATNWVGIWMIYEPREPRKVGPFTLRGLFLRRQDEASEDYARVISEEVITVENVTDELLHGPRSDRTRRIVEGTMRDVVDRAVGAIRPAVRGAIGTGEYETLRDSLAIESVEPTMEPLYDPDFSRARSEHVRELFTERMREMSAEDFSETMRAATREDEWMLVAHGAIFGIVGGLLHYAIFGV
jgi:uncharacterized membrane protein YheB (UPF0754 family)